MLYKILVKHILIASQYSIHSPSHPARGNQAVLPTPKEHRSVIRKYFSCFILGEITNFAYGNRSEPYKMEAADCTLTKRKEFALLVE